MSVVTVSRLELVSMFEQEAIVRLVGRTDGMLAALFISHTRTVKLPFFMAAYSCAASLSPERIYFASKPQHSQARHRKLFTCVMTD